MKIKFGFGQSGSWEDVDLGIQFSLSRIPKFIFPGGPIPAFTDLKSCIPKLLSPDFPGGEIPLDLGIGESSNSRKLVGDGNMGLPGK